MALGAQFGSKRHLDRAQRELEGQSVVPRKPKRPQKGAKMPPRTLIRRLVQLFCSEILVQMGAMWGKIRKM